MSIQRSDILQLTVAERIQLVEDIWNSVAAFPEAIPLTDAQKEELDRRLLAYAERPNEGISWDELKDRLRNPSAQS